MYTVQYTVHLYVLYCFIRWWFHAQGWPTCGWAGTKTQVRFSWLFVENFKYRLHTFLPQSTESFQKNRNLYIFVSVTCLRRSEVWRRVTNFAQNLWCQSATIKERTGVAEPGPTGATFTGAGADFSTFYLYGRLLSFWGWRQNHLGPEVKASA